MDNDQRDCLIGLCYVVIALCAAGAFMTWAMAQGVIP
jgi:hypothetical protein